MDGLPTPTYPFGKLVFGKITGAAAGASTDVKPSARKVWVVIAMWLYHDDTSSRSMYWSFTDDTTTLGSESSGSVAANVQLSIYDLQHQTNPGGQPPHPIILTNSHYAKANVTSIGAGKKAYIEYMVLEYTEGAY